MRRFAIIATLFASLLVNPGAWAYTLNSPSAGYVTTDGTRNDVQNAINDASVVDTWTVVIPSGTFTWTTNIVLAGKGLRFQGGGAGRRVGSSKSGTVVGTGSKTFTVQSGMGIANGQTLRFWLLGGTRNNFNGQATGTNMWMEGTVSSYSGTSLTMNMTSSSGSGTFSLWTIEPLATTTIILDRPNASVGTLFDLTEDTTHSIEITGIRFLYAQKNGSFIQITGTSGGKPVLGHDNYFQWDKKGPGGTNQGAGNAICVESISSNKGVFWSNSFVCVISGGVTDNECFKVEGTTGWQSLSTMGTNDTTGLNNFYIEDNDFSGGVTAVDFDDYGRGVLRNNLFDDAAAGGTHGPDTGLIGARHIEVYDNNFIFTVVGDLETMNFNRWFLNRGGTGLFTDNHFTPLVSSTWGTKPALNFQMQMLDRLAGPNPLWGDNTPTVEYHCPRQVGFGYVTGMGVDGLGRSNDGYEYVGDSEPFYVWNNTGSTLFVNSDWDSGNGNATNPDDVDDYIRIGSSGPEVITGVPKPNFVKSTYPHPARQVGGDSIVPTVSSATISANGTTWTFVCSEPVTIGSGGNGGFTTTLSGVTLTYASGSGTTSLVYTGSRTVNIGETGTLTYTQPGNGVEDIAGNDLVTFTGATVTNNSTQGGSNPAPPVGAASGTTGQTFIQGGVLFK